MELTMLKAKIHRATVTGAILDYEGSIALDPKLCEAAGLLEFERVDIYNCNTGARFSTYIIFGQSGEACLNGAAARLVQAGDLVIIAAYTNLTKDEAYDWKPTVVLVDQKNTIKEVIQK